MDGQTDGPTDGPTDGRTDAWTDAWTHLNKGFHFCLGRCAEVELSPGPNGARSEIYT